MSKALKNAGMEVIFGGVQNTEQIVESAIQEDVDVIYLNNYSSKCVRYREQVIKLFKKRGLKNQFFVINKYLCQRDDFHKSEEKIIENENSSEIVIGNAIKFIEKLLIH